MRRYTSWLLAFFTERFAVIYLNFTSFTAGTVGGARM